MKITLPFLLLATTLMVPIPNMAQESGTKSPTEAGRVNWIRDYEKGRRLVATANKPMLLLFQEVPG